MARLTGRESIYKVADLFRERCLIKGRSLLWPSHSSWTAGNLTNLWSAFIEHPDEGTRSFFEKWKDQLASQPRDIHRIAADIIVLYCLFPSRMTYNTKIASVKEVISWKLADEKPEWDLIDDAFSTSIGFPGPHYQTGRPWQVAFYIEYCRRIRLGEADPFDHNACKQVADAALKKVPANANTARHILMHLLFPDQFERVASDRQKHQILNAFRKYAANIEDVDNALASIRKNLIQHLGYGDTDFDFYNSDVRPRWQFISGKSDTEVTSQQQKWWIEKTYVEGNPDRMEGEYALGRALWSPQKSKSGADVYRFMREIKSGDAVLHLTDNDAFTGYSFAVGEYEKFGGVPNTEHGEGPSYIVWLRDFERLSPPLSRSIFFATPFKERLVELVEAGQGNLFYNRVPNLNQGAYLTPAPPELIAILDDAYRAAAGISISEIVIGQAIVSEPTYTIDKFVEETGFTEDIISGWIRRLQRKKYIIFQGPPGTGKTFLAERLAQIMISAGSGFWDLVQFHPSYTYEDFIQGLRPNPIGSTSFELILEPGRFLKFCERAIDSGESPCVLIIDEINRAHLSQVFGELMYLLEYPNKEIPLATGGKPFRIPPNVYIIGTMNTADRSIALVDHALRRRFSFIRLKPEYDVLKRHLERHGYPYESLINVLKEINKAINDLNYEVGISFFMRADDANKLREVLTDIWTSEIEPYLEEYFYDQQKKVDDFRWKNLMQDQLKEWHE